MRQLLFYQHNVQRYFLGHTDSYDGIVVPLSIAASFLDGTTGFLRALCATDNTKTFFLDPRTPLFQYNWNRKNVRAPHERAAKILGEAFKQGLNGPIQPGQFNDDEILATTTNCIKYQRRFSEHELEESRKIKKYMALAELEYLPELNNPQYFVPPYFRFSTIGDEWYEVSVKCIEAAKTLVDVNKICPIIHTHGLPDSGSWEPLIAKLDAIGICRVVLYPNNFREHDCSEGDLAKLSGATSAFASGGFEVTQLHGGYFAIAQQKRGLAAFGNGIGYGEWRDSNYHRGGSAEKRIYIPKLHRFLEPAAAQAIVNANSHFTGGSDLLDECVSTDTPLDALTSEQVLNDFMRCRDWEMHGVENSGIEELVADLNETAKILTAIGPFEKDYSTSLERWSKLIESWGN